MAYTQQTFSLPGQRYGSFAGKEASDEPSGPHTPSVLTQLAPYAISGGRYVFVAKGESAEPPPPTGQESTDTHDGERKVWYQRIYREPTRQELRSAIDRLSSEVVAELEALAEPQVQDSVYKPLELRIDIDELMRRTELAYQVMEAARLSDEEDDEFLLLT